MNIYTIGFTKKSAKYFFETIQSSNIDVVIDIRLNNTSQLAGFSKYPDIKFFLNELVNCEYIHDFKFAPSENILKDYKNKLIDWYGYVEQFDKMMSNEMICKYIKNNYSDYKGKNICLLCSEESHERCHRSLVALYFKQVFGGSIVDL